MYVKYQSNIEKHRNYITTFRVDDSYSSLYAANEDVFVSIGKGEGNGNMKETLYRMDKVESNLLKNFMYVKNQGLLFNKTNIDVNGKATIQDPDTNRPIYIGDGLVPQIERFASKYGYNKLTVPVMQTAINMMCQKAENPTGNKFTFVVNEALWNQIQLALSEWLARFQTCGTYLWSKEANGYVKVGATFSTYEIGGNEITFKVDRSLSREYGDKGYGIMIDLTADKASGQPAIAAFTFKGGEFISSKYPGVGGLDGMSSGIVSSPVAASKLIIHGYAGIGVFSPYRSFILFQN